MSSIPDFLAKQLFIEKNVVTYRSLSRQFKIHVNVAKNELATYHATPQSSAEQSYATYIISGELFPRASSQPLSTEDDTQMDVDEPQEGQEDEPEVDSDLVPQVKITLVGEKDLEQAKTQYARIFSEHIYCLSPSPLVDSSLICAPSANIYKADAKLSPEQSILLGRVVGPDVKIGKVQPLPAASSKGKAPATTTVRKPGLAASASLSKVKEEPKAESIKAEKKADEVKPKDSKSPPVISKPKPSGKLDFSKAKAKAKEEKKTVKEEEPSEREKTEPIFKIGPPSRAKRETKGKSTASKKPVKRESSSSATSPSEPPPRRGTKRKSAMPIDSDSEQSAVTETPAPSGPSRSISPVPKSRGKAKTAAVKVKKGIVLSDDEDDEDEDNLKESKVSKSYGRKKTVIKEVDPSLSAMMDMDDDSVIKHPRRVTPPPPSDTEQTDEPDEDVAMEDDEDLPKPIPKKKKVKKAIPVGRNGLKKRRVVKSRMTTDAKGYIITEDYSEYESVDEEEPEEPKPKAKKPAARGKKSDSEEKSSKVSSKEKGGKSSAATKGSKSGTSSKVKKTMSGGLMDFFGKK
ncbi:unnamed protein product [Somion occarium]|uniref:DNA polymerase delta subunit 3 n=1 Tax=Somion occarium TaxID=3059160 RepID=A0ABP1CXZ7_9APHY